MPSTASAGETQQLGEGGLLPPPPERFPQRVAPPVANAKPAAKPAQAKPAQPKPAQQQKTASSGAQPAKPPLPKSKPAAPAASTPAPAPAAAPPPAKKNESDDVPH